MFKLIKTVLLSLLIVVLGATARKAIASDVHKLKETTASKSK